MKKSVWITILFITFNFLKPISAASEPIQVGAYYFGIFSADASYLPAAQRVYGRSDWWAGVSDFYQKSGAPYVKWSSGDFSHLKPLIGYYDQSEVSTLEKHIDMAANGGLSFFNFYYYWSKKHRTDQIAVGLKSFLKAQNTLRMKFQLSIFSHPWDEDLQIPENQFQEFSEFVIKNYLTQKNYLKINRQPVITIGDGKGIGDGSAQAVDRLILALRIAADRWLVGKPGLVVLIGPGALIDWYRVKGVQGTQTHMPNHGNMQPGIRYRDWIDGVIPFFDMVTRGLNLPLAPSFASNFDERPRQDIMIPNSNDIRYFTQTNFEDFESGLSKVMNYSKNQPSEISKIITIYAWNEWHEGGIIEPDTKNKDRYLKIISSLIQKYK